MIKSIGSVGWRVNYEYFLLWVIMMTAKNKLRTFWRSRKTWNYAFLEWQVVMFPHLHPAQWDEVDGSYWFWEALNNYDNFFDDWL
jgi:hypothetical protein